MIVLVCFQDPSTPCYTMSSQWSSWWVCRLRLRPGTQRTVSGRLGVFAGSVYALLHNVQSVVVLVCLQDPSTPCYTASSQWSYWCVCRIRLRPATQCPVSGRIGVFAGSVYVLLHSVQSVVVLVCLQDPSTPCYTVSSQWSSWFVCRIRLRPATQCPVSGRLPGTSSPQRLLRCDTPLHERPRLPPVGANPRCANRLSVVSTVLF